MKKTRAITLQNLNCISRHPIRAAMHSESDQRVKEGPCMVPPIAILNNPCPSPTQGAAQTVSQDLSLPRSPLSVELCRALTSSLSRSINGKSPPSASQSYVAPVTAVSLSWPLSGPHCCVPHEHSCRSLHTTHCDLGIDGPPCPDRKPRHRGGK